MGNDFIPFVTEPADQHDRTQLRLICHTFGAETLRELFAQGFGTVDCGSCASKANEVCEADGDVRDQCCVFSLYLRAAVSDGTLTDDLRDLIGLSPEAEQALRDDIALQKSSSVRFDDGATTVMD